MYEGVVYSSVRKFDVCWTGSNVGAYYKAGCYCQVNNITGDKYDGTGACQVSFYAASQPILSKTRFAFGPLFPSNSPVITPNSKTPTIVPSLKPSVQSVSIFDTG